MNLKICSNVKVFFVNESGNLADGSKLMMLSYVKMLESFKKTDNIHFISSGHLSSLIPQIKSKSIFVLEDGQLFESLASIQVIVLGPGTILNSELCIYNEQPSKNSSKETAMECGDKEQDQSRDAGYQSQTNQSAIINQESGNFSNFCPEATEAPARRKTPWLTNETAYTEKSYKAPTKELDEHLTSEQEYENPLSKRRRLDDITDSQNQSPNGMSASDNRPEKVVRNSDEMPKGPSTSFPEIRKRLYRDGFGDTPSCSASSDPSKVLNVDDVGINTKDTKDGNTQAVQEFFDAIKTCRDSRPFHRHDTQQLSKTEIVDLSSDTEEENSDTIDWCDPEDKPSPPLLKKSKSTLERTMCFSVSSDAERRILMQILELGGTVCKLTTAFDASCTHQICAKPNKKIETLSMIASGRWLLCSAYIEDSFKAGHFLNEEDYEWGNPKAKSRLPSDLDADSNEMATVSHQWRRELQSISMIRNTPAGIFSGFRAILHVTQNDSFSDSFKMLFEAGCGTVVNLKKPYAKQTDFQTVTHCFVDKRMMEISNSDKKAMKKSGIHCVNLLYLKACVLEGNLVSVDRYAAF